MEKEYKYLRNSLESVVNATERITTGNVAHEIGAIKCYTKLSQGYLDKLKQIEANGSKLKQIEAK